MANYLSYPPSYDPIATFMRIHGRPPPGMERASPSEVGAAPPPVSAEPERLLPAEAEPAPEEPPPETPQEPLPPRCSDASVDALDGCAPPPLPLPAGEGDEEGKNEAPAPIRLTASPELQEWLTGNWETITALAEAGRLPNLDAARAPAEAPPPAPPPRPIHVAKGDRWNKHKMTCFLRELAATHSVSAAAKSVGMSRESAHRLRNRLKGQPFDVAWEAASRHGYDALADAALDRAINGVEVPHYANGELVGTHRRYNDHLTVALLKMRNDRGAPAIGRYGAAAEWMTERWDAALERVETGSVGWSDEHRALGDAERAELDLPDDKAAIDALIQKHFPTPGYEAPKRK